MENSESNNQGILSKDVKLSKLSLEFLQETAPWMKFISILGFILCGLMAIMAIVSLVVSVLGPGMAFITFLVYIIAAIVMIFPNIYLFNYAREINEFCLLNDPESLETAFEMQKKYWKYMGIIAIIYLAFIVIAILVGIIAALSSGF